MPVSFTFRGANVALSFDVPSPEAAHRRGFADANVPQSLELGVAHHGSSLDPPAAVTKK